MTRRIIGVLGGVTSAALVATALQAPAVAAPPQDPTQQGLTAPARKDDRPDRLEAKRRAMIKKAHEKVIRGEATVEDRRGSKSVRVAPGQWAQYELQSSDEVLSFLVEFGDTKDARFPDAPVGPRHNEIPEPGPSDNTTYWVEDFDRGHYLDMFFNGMPEQDGESFKDIYEEMSSGRYTVDGDVSEWVQLEHHEASYGQTESNKDMTRFIDDTAEAWLDAQKAKGKSHEEIAQYLSRFDQWDRYDHDSDGDFGEPDGYIDHFQAIHAGEGQEAGAPSWAIWSHRWAANVAGTFVVGPEGAPFGGIEIGDTGFWIRDYTTEPENGGLGVFAHEYAHDLGLPDLYDTSGGENGTGFWTLMSSGSWLGHGEGAIGTTPNHMGAWEKLQLGWLDYAVAHADTSSEHMLGPSFHATKQAQALAVVLPEHTVTQDLGAAAEGDDFFYSGRRDRANATMTSPEFTVPADGALDAKVNYAIEDDWDYAFVEVRSPGGDWTPIETNLSTTTDPNGQNDGFGITGDSGGKWVDLSASLADYAGQAVQLRFRMYNDAAINEMGIKVDAVTVGDALSEGAEDGAPDWTLDKFVIAENGQTSAEYDHYYLAENRQYLGYDSTLETGPYNFGFAQTAPDKVEHFPYQNGLLIWYWNTQYADNNTRTHPGGGEVLPVDARAEALRWSDGSEVRNRIQAFDATFGTERTDAISLQQERIGGTRTLDVASQAPVRVFDDSDPNAYYDPANPGGSVIVGGTGTTIRVETSNRNGMMKVLVN